MRIQIELPRKAIEAFCFRWKIQELSLFGSVLRPDFNENSDIDFLVTFYPDARPTLFDLVRMQDELEALLNRKVDLVSRRGIESGSNQLRKNTILESAEIIHAT